MDYIHVDWRLALSLILSPANDNLTQDTQATQRPKHEHVGYL